MEAKSSQSYAKSAGVVALITVILLSIPLTAMHFTNEVNLTLSDFAVMGVIIFVFGMLIDLANRKVGRNRAFVIMGIVLLFIWLWAELAVGVFTNWGS